MQCCWLGRKERVPCNRLFAKLCRKAIHKQKRNGTREEREKTLNQAVQWINSSWLSFLTCSKSSVGSCIVLLSPWWSANTGSGKRNTVWDGIQERVQTKALNLQLAFMFHFCVLTMRIILVNDIQHTSRLTCFVQLPVGSTGNCSLSLLLITSVWILFVKVLGKDTLH